jgi:hypothetical protein
MPATTRCLLDSDTLIQHFTRIAGLSLVDWMA